jgi:ATP-binding cassette subfamily D (ALD) protein 4
MELAEGLTNLEEDLREVDDDDDDKVDDGSTSDNSDDPDDGVVFSLKNVTIAAPRSSTPLITALNLDLAVGTNVLIMGRSSAGKSSLLRVLRGLWRPTRGVVDRRLHADNVLFLPQKPFFTDGSLREQISYPLEVQPKDFVDHTADAWIVSTLEELGMGDLVRRCGGSLDSEPTWSSSWQDQLSPGETQRLAFVRLFFHRPKLALLDEATSALSADVEELLYHRCEALGITLVSVGHREDLRRYHSRLLKIGLVEGWTLDDIL